MGFHLYTVAFAILATGQFRRNSFPVMHWIMRKVLWDERCYINSKALWRTNATLFKSQMLLPLITWRMPFKLTQLLAFYVASGLLLENLCYSSWELTVETLSMRSCISFVYPEAGWGVPTKFLTDTAIQPLPKGLEWWRIRSHCRHGCVFYSILFPLLFPII